LPQEHGNDHGQGQAVGYVQVLIFEQILDTEIHHAKNERETLDEVEIRKEIEGEIVAAKQLILAKKWNRKAQAVKQSKDCNIEKDIAVMVVIAYQIEGLQEEQKINRTIDPRQHGSRFVGQV